MVAIYKKELRGYLTSMIGYVFIAFLLLLAGIYFTAYNLMSAYPQFGVVLSAVTFIFLIGVPVLTMKVIAEERKQKTDQMLLTAPVSVGGIVIGKYLALITVYIIPILVMCLYPLIMAKYGTVSFAMAYASIFGFFLLGCANLSIGVFLSAVTENQVIAAVLTFVVLFVCYIIDGLASFFSQTAISTCLALAVVIAAAAILVYNMIGNAFLAFAAGAIGEIILFVVYLLKSSIFEGGIQKILAVFNISSHFDNFVNGIFDLTSVIYFLSIIVLCLFLTIQSILKRRWN